MPRLTRLLMLAALASLALAAPAAAQSGAPGAAPSAKVLYEQGPSGRFLLDGTWLRRLDPSDTGLQSGWATSTDTADWTKVTVPNAWNVNDESMASYLGGVGWYRRDFRLPAGAAASAAWIVRFESINYAATVWLNGRRLATHKGAFEPFEVALPASAVKRGEVNRLVVRIDTRRTESDLPPAITDARGRPRGCAAAVRHAQPWQATRMSECRLRARMQPSIERAPPAAAELHAVRRRHPAACCRPRAVTARCLAPALAATATAPPGRAQRAPHARGQGASCGRTARRQPSISPGCTKVVSMPKRLSV